MSREHIAQILGISEATLYSRQREDPKFVEAFNQGVAEGVAAVSGELLKMIKAGSIRAMMYYLNCKAGWKETSIVEHKNTTDIPPDDCTPEEAEAAYAASMKLIK